MTSNEILDKAETILRNRSRVTAALIAVVYQHGDEQYQNDPALSYRLYEVGDRLYRMRNRQLGHTSRAHL